MNHQMKKMRPKVQLLKELRLRANRARPTWHAVRLRVNRARLTWHALRLRARRAVQMLGKVTLTTTINHGGRLHGPAKLLEVTFVKM